MRKCENFECSNQFEPYRGRQKYCSKKCAKRVEYINTKELYKARARQWRKMNPEKYRQNHTKWRLENPEKIKGYSSKYQKKYGAYNNREYRIRKGLKGKSCKLYQWCNFCQKEHLRSSINHHIIYKHNNDHTPQFLCKKEALYRSKIWDKNNPESVRKAKKKWKKEHPEARRKTENRQAALLTDGYVRRSILRVRDAPNDLIEIKRIHLKIQRELNHVQLKYNTNVTKN